MLRRVHFDMGRLLEQEDARPGDLVWCESYSGGDGTARGDFDHRVARHTGTGSSGLPARCGVKIIV